MVGTSRIEAAILWSRAFFGHDDFHLLWNLTTFWLGIQTIAALENRHQHQVVNFNIASGVLLVSTCDLIFYFLWNCVLDFRNAGISYNASGVLQRRNGVLINYNTYNSLFRFWSCESWSDRFRIHETFMAIGVIFWAFPIPPFNYEDACCLRL